MASGFHVDRVEMDVGGMRRIMKSDAMRKDLEKRADAIAEEACALVGEHALDAGYIDGEYFKTDSREGVSRVLVTVYGTKTLSHRMQASHDVLTHAIDAGR